MERMFSTLNPSTSTASTSTSGKRVEYVDLTDSPPPARPLSQSTANNHSTPYVSYIKPAKAFPTPASNKFNRAEGWPAWIQPKPQAKEATNTDQEAFDLDSVKLTADDWTKHEGDPEAHMRELLSAAVGEEDEEIKDGEDRVEGFADAVRLMPHQIRGVKWMRGRESGRKFGGILADVSGLFARADVQDMGLGKTVQTLARMVEGVPSAADRKAGFRGTL